MSGDWGEEFGESQPAASEGAGRAFGIDVNGFASEVVDQAVKGAIRKEISTIATKAVSEALTEDVLDTLRERASLAAAAAVDEQLAANETDEPALEEPQLYFGSVDEFVREYLRHSYRRQISGDGSHRVWAADWWRYDEAVIRLEALWRAWESLRLDPATGMSSWYRDHADHHMAVLMDPDGPFKGVRGDEHACKKGEPLPYLAPPEDLFPDVREYKHVPGHSAEAAP